MELPISRNKRVQHGFSDELGPNRCLCGLEFWEPESCRAHVLTERAILKQQIFGPIVDAMFAKLEKRAAKHPNDNFLALTVKELALYNVEPLENHMIEEMAEFIATMDNPSPFLRDFAIRVLGDEDYAEHRANRSVKDKKKEFVDLANMATILFDTYTAKEN